MSLGAGLKNKGKNYMWLGMILTNSILAVYFVILYFLRTEWAAYFSTTPATQTAIL